MSSNDANFRSSFRYEFKRDVPLLHSFFVEDIRCAIEQLNDNESLLSRYLLSIDPKSNFNAKQALAKDSDSDSKACRTLFRDCLWPKNYPLGRFPSDPKYGLSLMQQVAVNLAVDIDSDKTRLLSVNGPPGTGKTTLLKDVFADFVVQQAFEIAKLEKKKLETFTALPEQIYRYGMVVASSNNGAVQNIVKELPKLDGVWEKVKDDLNYFKQERSEFLKELEASKKSKQSTPSTDGDWGCFSMEGGKKANLTNLSKMIERIANLQPEESLEKTCSDFLHDYAALAYVRAVLQKSCLKSSLSSHRPRFYFIKNLLRGHAPEVKAYRDLKNELKKCESMLRKLKPHLKKPLDKDLCDLIKKYQFKPNADKQDEKAYQLNFDFSEDLNLAYNAFQQSNPWNSEVFRCYQVKLFAQALKVREQFLRLNAKNLKNALDTWKNKDRASDIAASWHWINLAIPVISTTFASVRNMFKELSTPVIANLFIDEAGQATAQSAIGAILRSKRVMAVGDPAQIKPVVSLPKKLVSFIAERYNVKSEYLSDGVSVQTFMDQASHYGYRSEGKPWIGIPLWVHRRCDAFMFEIANCISYDGNMVLGKDPDKCQGEGCWYDVRGNSENKYVLEQADKLLALLNELDDDSKGSVYVITPFKNVSEQLKTILNNNNLQAISKNTGTVHTFQGKEADIVFLVMGASSEEQGAATWAVNEPNIMNVAATRAKKAFYVIGDWELYHEKGCVAKMNELFRGRIVSEEKA